MKKIFIVLAAIVITSQTIDLVFHDWQEIQAMLSSSPFTAFEAGILTSKAIILASFCAGCIYALQKFKVLKRLAAVKAN